MGQWKNRDCTRVIHLIKLDVEDWDLVASASRQRFLYSCRGARTPAPPKLTSKLRIGQGPNCRLLCSEIYTLRFDLPVIPRRGGATFQGADSRNGRAQEM